MSNTTGATPVAPVNAVPVMFTLMPPGFWLVSHAPEDVRAACSWYCHRLFKAGRTHAPTLVLHATGATHWVVPHATVAAWAGAAANPTGATVRASRNALITKKRSFTEKSLRFFASRVPAEIAGQADRGAYRQRAPQQAVSQRMMSESGMDRSDSAAQGGGDTSAQPASASSRWPDRRPAATGLSWAAHEAFCWRVARAFSRAVGLASMSLCWWVRVQVLIMAGSGRGRPAET